MDDRRPTRRALLAEGAATAVAAVAGCGRSGAPAVAAATGSAGSTTTPASTAVTTTAAAVVTTAPPATWAVAVAAGERSLVASYNAVIKAHPGLKPALTPLRAAHLKHLKALKVSGAGKAMAGLPAGRAEALSRLAAAEQKASDTTGTVCLNCPREAAALLGSIAAADASHVLVLQSIGSA